MRSFAVLCLVTQLCLTLCNPMNCNPPGSSVHRDSPGKNTGVGCHALLQGIFLTHGSDPGLLHCMWSFHQLRHQGSPRILEWLVYPFCRGTSQPRNCTRVSCTAGRFITSWGTGNSGKPMSFYLFCFAVYLDLSHNHNQNQNLCFSLWTHIMCVLFCCSLVELRHCLPHLWRQVY